MTRGQRGRRKAASTDDLASSLERLSQTCLNADRLDRARTAVEEAYKLRRKALGEDDPRTARDAFSLGDIRFLAGDTPEAIALFQRALASRLKSLPDHHPDVIQSLNRLAGLLGIAGELDDAYRLRSR